MHTVIAGACYGRSIAGGSRTGASAKTLPSSEADGSNGTNFEHLAEVTRKMRTSSDGGLALLSVLKSGAEEENLGLDGAEDELGLELLLLFT